MNVDTTRLGYAQPSPTRTHRPVDPTRLDIGRQIEAVRQNLEHNVKKLRAKCAKGETEAIVRVSCIVARHYALLHELVSRYEAKQQLDPMPAKETPRGGRLRVIEKPKRYGRWSEK